MSEMIRSAAELVDFATGNTEAGFYVHGTAAEAAAMLELVDHGICGPIEHLGEGKLRALFCPPGFNPYQLLNIAKNRLQSRSQD